MTTPTPAPAPMTARLRELMEEATNARDDQRRAEAVHDGDAWQKAGYREIAALNERDLLIHNNAPTILRLLEAVEGAEKALAELPQKVLDNATLCHELSVKLAVNGEHAMAEMQRIRAEQSAGLAEAIKRETDAALATLRAAREGAR